MITKISDTRSDKHRRNSIQSLYTTGRIKYQNTQEFFNDGAYRSTWGQKYKLVRKSVRRKIIKNRAADKRIFYFPELTRYGWQLL